MSFAIFKTGGKQYKVQASEILKIEKLELSKDNKIEFNEILAYGDKKNVELGFPLIKGAKIEAELIKNSKERTVLVFKKRRRKNSRKKYGHRQPISLIRITKIFSRNGKLIAQAESKKEKVPAKIKDKVEAKTRKSTQKTELETKKISTTKKKTIIKKKPLTAKKK